MSFLRSAFQSTLLIHAGEDFLFRVMQTFKFKKCLGTLLRKRFAQKSFKQRAINASWLINYFHVPTTIGFTVFLCFLTDMRCCENLSVAEKTEIWNSCEYQSNVKIWKL